MIRQRRCQLQQHVAAGAPPALSWGAFYAATLLLFIVLPRYMAFTPSITAMRYLQSMPSSFLPGCYLHRESMSLSSVAMTRLFMAKKKKMSMAEKRRKRAKSTARVQNNPFPFRPPAIDTKDPSVNTPEETSSAPVTSSNKAFAGKETVVTKNQATNKALT